MRPQSLTTAELSTEQPLVSVLMPLYNGLNYLDSAVRSLIWQTLRAWELLIVDDGSTDGSLARAQSWAERDARIRVLPRPHQGIVETLNYGLSQCTAPLVARMDSDDISHPQRLERQWQFAQQHPEVGVIGCKVRLFPRRERTLGMKRYERWLNRCLSSSDIAQDIFVESPFVHPSVTIHRSLLQANGGYRHCPWPEDYDLWLRLWSQDVAMAKVPQVLFYWRDNLQRLTRTDERCSHSSLRRLKIAALLQRYAAVGKARPAIIWGAGSNSRDLVKDLWREDLHPQAFIDNHPSRLGQKILGMPVWSREQLPPPHSCFIIMAVSNPYIRAEIRQFLGGRGWIEGKDFICLANIAK